MIEWISVNEMLPEHGERVLIWNGGVDVATFKKGITEEEREKMKSGQLEDLSEEIWCAMLGYVEHKRSDIRKPYDMWANNLVAYGWDVGGTVLFGQNVTHWAKYNTPEEYKQQRIKDLQHKIDVLHYQMKCDEFRDEMLPATNVGYIHRKGNNNDE